MLHTNAPNRSLVVSVRSNPFIISHINRPGPLYLSVSQGYIAELQLSALLGMASHPDIHNIRIIEFIFENWLHWQSEVRLLLFTVTYLRLNQCFSTAGPRPGAEPWHQLYRTARGLRKLQYATRFH